MSKTHHPAPSDMRTVVVVQARMSSSRLPGKVLADVDGEPLLRLLLRRLKTAQTVDDVIVAIPEGPDDDELETAIVAWGYRVHRGPENDVLTRFVQSAKLGAAELVVRITGDCPLVDGRTVDLVTTLATTGQYEYIGLDESWPDGAGCEAITAELLYRLPGMVESDAHREHVTVYIRENLSDFRTLLLPHSPDLGDARLTVDTPEDLERVDHVVAASGHDVHAPIEEFAGLLSKSDRNGRRAARNEGLWLSRRRDIGRNLGQRSRLTTSAALLERARRVIPQATQTISKGSTQFVEGVTPAFLQSGTGCYVTDVDGNHYIDYPMALGPVILGHGHPAVVEAVSREITRSSTFTLPHPLEIEVAEQIVDMVPSAQMVRFAKNGSDVTSAAVRLARAITGRDTILTTGYHGWHDWYVAGTARNRGVPSELSKKVRPFGINDRAAFDELMEHAEDVAAVVLEVGYDPPTREDLGYIVDRTRRAGGLVIWDEIVSGFRWAPGGAQDYYDVAPDLSCFGKALANGMPLAALAGPEEIMKEVGSIFFSGTFGGETASLAAAKATLEIIREEAVPEGLWQRGKTLRDGLEEVFNSPASGMKVLGVPPRLRFDFQLDGRPSPALRGLFFQETVRRGVLFGGPIFVTHAHGDRDIEFTLEVCAAAQQVVAEAVETGQLGDRLEGPPPDIFTLHG